MYSCIHLQVMSESVVCALEFLDNDTTQQTRVFIRMIDRFFDYMNVSKESTALSVKEKEQHCSLQDIQR